MDAELPYLTSAQMREIEAAAMRSGAVTGLELMETAAIGVCETSLRHWPELATSARKAWVLCGPGNNGGDGYAIARLLAQRGWSVGVTALFAPVTEDARAMAARWRALGPVETGDAVPAGFQGCDLVVDAVFGSGLTRPFESHGAVQQALAQAWRRHLQGGQGPRVVAVDVPSGLCADSGRVLGCAPGVLPPDAVGAHMTVTFETPFPGHVLAEGPALCGAVRVVPLGRAVAQARHARRVLCHAVARPQPERIAKLGAAHKYDHGHALVVTGPAGHTGAARLAARAALRIGAGLVSLAAPDAALPEIAAQITALMLRACPTGADLAAQLQADARLNALVLGPGLGLDARAAGLVAAGLQGGRPCVLDADALTLLARDPDLAGLVHAACVLTPHEGEFARLWPDLAAALAAVPREGPALSRRDVVAQAARRVGAVVVLKGPCTVIGTPEGYVWLHGGAGRAAPWLATAGSGDVLAGMIAGLLARGWSAPQAACDAVWLHAEAARGFGAGLIAEDLPEALPGVFRSLGL